MQMQSWKPRLALILNCELFLKMTTPEEVRSEEDRLQEAYQKASLISELACFFHIYIWTWSDLRHKIPSIFEDAVATEFPLREEGLWRY